MLEILSTLLRPIENHLPRLPGHHHVEAFLELRVGEAVCDDRPNVETLASASVLGSVLLWDVKSGKRTATFQRFNPYGREQDINPAYSVAFSPDDKMLAAGTLLGIKLWDVESGENVVPLSRPVATVWSVAFRSDGKTLASAGSKGLMRRVAVGPRDPRAVDPTLRLWEWVPSKKADK